jgi:hypothetical protein
MFKNWCLLMLLTSASYVMGGGDNDGGGRDVQYGNATAETSRSAASKINALMPQLGHTWIMIHQVPGGGDGQLYGMQVNMRAMLQKVGLSEITISNPQPYPEWAALHANLDAISQKLSQKK